MSLPKSEPSFPRLTRKLREFLAANAGRLLAGLPALLALAGLAALARAASLPPDGRLIQTYRRQAEADLADGRFARAQVCLERLIQIDELSSSYRFLLATAHEGQGQAYRAADIVNDLAPLDHPGYPKAHLKVARMLIARKPRTPKDLQEAEIHLHHALSLSADGIEAYERLAGLYLAQGRRADAEALLARASKSHPEFLLLRASLARGRKDEETAQRLASEALTVFQARVKGHPDKADDYLRAAQAQALLRDFGAAESILNEGLNRTDDPKIRAALAKVDAAWSESLARSGRDESGARLALIERGLRQNPSEPALLSQLGALMRSSGPDADRARAALTALLTRGKVSAWAHLLLGVDAAGRGRKDESRMHFEQAYRVAPELPSVANNLAWMLANAQPPDLDRALSLVETALKAKPENLAYHHTRGWIFMKQKRWPEALTDLEFVLARNPDHADVHRLLAEVYDQLGSADLAAEHRRLDGRKGPSPGQTAP